jgi:hypothetical protein
MFRYALIHFVERWEPTDLRDRNDFHRHLMMLFRDAMSSQAEAYGAVIAQQMAMQLLASIFIKRCPKPFCWSGDRLNHPR